MKTLAELQATHPDLYAEAISAGVAQAASANESAIAQAKKDGHLEGVTAGVTAERARIKEIHDMALPGTEAISNKAMFESGATAAEYAMELVKAQKEKGVNFLASAKKDAAELLAVAAEVAKTIRG